MTAKVISFPDGGVTGHGTKIAAHRVLAGARAAKLREVVVLGYDEDGGLYATSTDGPGDTVWLIKQAKAWIIEGCPE